MVKKRRKTFPLETAEQLRVISSPVRFAIIQALQHLGPTPVSVLGPRIGKKSNSLHYHIRELIRLGMLRQTGTQRSGARTEAIYDVVADRFVGEDLRRKRELQKATNDTVASLLRTAARDFANASDRADALAEKGKERNIFAQRFAARLTDEQLCEVNECLTRVEQIFTSNIGSEDGRMCALTAVLTPLIIPDEDNKARGNTK